MASFQLQPNSKLLSILPRELRDKIWAYTFASEHVDSEGRAVEYIKPGQYRQPTILQVSRQIREEAESLYYANMLFLDASYEYSWFCKHFTDNINLDGANSVMWLRSLSPTARKHIKFIGLVEFYCRDEMYYQTPRGLLRKGPVCAETVQLVEAFEALGVKKRVIRFVDGDWDNLATGVEDFGVERPVWDEHRWEAVGELAVRKRGEEDIVWW